MNYTRAVLPMLHLHNAECVKKYNQKAKIRRNFGYRIQQLRKEEG